MPTRYLVELLPLFQPLRSKGKILPSFLRSTVPSAATRRTIWLCASLPSPWALMYLFTSPLLVSDGLPSCSLPILSLVHEEKFGPLPLGHLSWPTWYQEATTRVTMSSRRSIGTLPLSTALVSSAPQRLLPLAQ